MKKIKDKIVWLSSAEANAILMHLLFLVVILTSLFMTTSRGGILSFLSAIIIFFAGCLITARPGKRARIILPFLLMLALIAVMVLWVGPEAIIEKVGGLNKAVKIFLSERTILSDTRPVFWKNTLSLVRDFPVLGIGLGSYMYVFPMYRTFPEKFGILEYAHNDYLQFIAEMGMPGVICIILFFIWYARRIRECLLWMKK